MPKCCSEFHPQVPQSSVVAVVSHCRQCGSYRLVVNSWCQHGDRVERGTERPVIEFGPFDTWEEINALALEHFDNVLNAPGVPWDHRPGCASS